MQTQNRVLYIDIDDTIVDTALLVIESVLANFPGSSRGSAQQLRDKYLQPGAVPEFAPAEISTHIEDCLNSEKYIGSLVPRPEAAGILQEMAADNEIKAYISSRSERLQEVTQKWLDKNAFPSAEVILRSHYDTNPAWKLEYIGSQKESAILIEDNHELVKLLHLTDPERFELWLIQQEKNITGVHTNAPNLRYFSSLQDVYEKFFRKSRHAQA